MSSSIDYAEARLGGARAATGKLLCLPTCHNGDCFEKVTHGSGERQVEEGRRFYGFVNGRGCENDQ